ncbi:MAG: polymorphic toxin type 23 domain-containing protein, partial [Bacteroidota bacterium]
CRYGYRDLSATEWGIYSHGILALEWQYGALPFQQIAATALGIDAEAIRHILQNKIIHDGLSFPNRPFSSPNPHIPMLDQNGAPYLFHPDQEIRSARFFGQFALNPPLFY